MGIFNTNINEYYESYDDIPADESYTYPTGCGRILSEIAQNDLTMFTALIQRDFEESALISEGYGGFDLEVITEGIGDIFGAIIKLLKKLWEKIKGIFKQFMAKFNSVVITDNKKYYDKYKKLVNGSVKWDGFKCKYSKAKKDIENCANLIDKAGKESRDALGTLFSNTLGMKKETGEYIIYGNKLDQDAFDKAIEDDEFLIKCLETTGVKLSEASDFNKEFHELFFEDEESIDDVHEIKTRVEQVLSQGSKFGSELEKILKAAEKTVRAEVKEVEKERSDVLKHNPVPKDAPRVDLTGLKYGSKADQSMFNTTGKRNNEWFNDDGGKGKFDINKNKASKYYEDNMKPNSDGRWVSHNDNKSPNDSFMDGNRRFVLSTHSDEVNVPMKRVLDSDNISKNVKSVTLFDSNDANKAQKIASNKYTAYNIWQNAFAMLHTAILNEIKFETKQCRSAFAAMVAHALRGKNQIGPNNESSLLEFAQEGAEFEFDSMFGIV